LLLLFSEISIVVMDVIVVLLLVVVIPFSVASSSCALDAAAVAFVKTIAPKSVRD